MQSSQRIPPYAPPASRAPLPPNTREPARDPARDRSSARQLPSLLGADDDREHTMIMMEAPARPAPGEAQRRPAPRPATHMQDPRARAQQPAPRGADPYAATTAAPQPVVAHLTAQTPGPPQGAPHLHRRPSTMPPPQQGHTQQHRMPSQRPPAHASAPPGYADHTEASQFPPVVASAAPAHFQQHGSLSVPRPSPSQIPPGVHGHSPMPPGVHGHSPMPPHVGPTARSPSMHPPNTRSVPPLGQAHRGSMRPSARPPSMSVHPGARISQLPPPATFIRQAPVSYVMPAIVLGGPLLLAMLVIAAMALG